MRMQLALSLLLLYFNVFSQPASLYEEQFFVVGDDTLRCRILTPLNFVPGKKYPLVVFLHGSGERGEDNVKQLVWGADFFADSASRARFPAIIIFPQCPTEEYWASVTRTDRKDSLGGFIFDTTAPARKPLAMTLQFIDTLVANGGIDAQRIYLGGLSMGGFGTLEALWRRPDLFAAGFSICGGGVAEKTRLYGSKLPVWVFHGDADPVVPVQFSRLMVPAMKAHGVRVQYTEYPGVGHDSWKNAFAEKELMAWIFAQRKPTKSKK